MQSKEKAKIDIHPILSILHPVRADILPEHLL